MSSLRPAAGSIATQGYPIIFEGLKRVSHNANTYTYYISVLRVTIVSQPTLPPTLQQSNITRLLRVQVVPDRRFYPLDELAYTFIYSEDDGLARGHTENTGRNTLVEGRDTFRFPHVTGDSEDSLHRRLAWYSGGFLQTCWERKGVREVTDGRWKSEETRDAPESEKRGEGVSRY